MPLLALSALPAPVIARLRAHALPVVLYVAILAGCIFRFHETFVHNPIDQIFSDPQRHWTFGHETLHPDPWLVIDPPFFQMWLSLVQKWSTGIPKMTAVYAGALSVATPWLWYRFLREAVGRHTLALLGWALLVWLPSWIGIYTYFMSETLFLPLIGASLWQTMRARRMQTVSSVLGMVALWTLAGLTRGIAIPLGGMAGLWVWLAHPKKSRTVAYSAVIVLAATVPFAFRNHDFLGLWSPIGTGWPNQIYAESGKREMQVEITRDGAKWNYTFRSPSEDERVFSPFSSWESKRDGMVQLTVDLRKGSADWRRVSEHTAQHGIARLLLQWENLILVMFGQTWPDDNFDFPIARAANRMRFGWAPLLGVFFVIALVRRRAVFSRPLLPVLILTWFVFQAASLLAINEGRYRKPLEGLLSMEAIVLLDVALSRRRLATLTVGESRSA
jgi:hypothetical protein